MQLRRAWPILVSTLLLGLTACGSSSETSSADDTGSSEPTSASDPSDAPESSDAPDTSPSAADFALPATLDKGKFCSGIKESAVAAAMGVPIAKRGTEGRDPKNLYCFYENKKRTVGVTITWYRNPTNPIRETRKILQSDPSYVEAKCKFPDVGSLDADLALQTSCSGYDQPGKFFPRREEIFFQVGKTFLYCSVYAPPKQTLAVDAGDAASLCQDVVTSLA
jgi:hypothetical protein